MISDHPCYISTMYLFIDALAAGVQAEEADIHAITGVLKLYFRELPEPLFTDYHYQSFIQTIRKFLYSVMIRIFFHYFRNMTHTHGIGNFSSVLLKIGKNYMTAILQLFNEEKESLSKMISLII